MKPYLKILVILTTILSLSACGNAEQDNSANKEPIKIPRKIEKVISSDQIFVFGESQTDISFNKLAVAQAKEIAQVAPQVSGIIKTIHIKIGSKVQAGSKLITLGNSLSTDISNIQAQSANEALKIALNSQGLSTITSENTVELAKLSVEQAQKALKNAQKAKDNTEDLFDEQSENLEDNLDKLEDAYSQAKDAYYSAKDELDQAYQSGDQSQIESAITAVNATKKAKSETESALENAQSSLEQLETTQDSQLDQLDFAITSAGTQLKAAEQQLESAKTGIKQQELLTESQVVQAESAKDMAQKSTEYTIIKAPISGTVTGITAKTGNLASPGIPVITIEQTDKIVLKASLSEFEGQLVSNNDIVEIKTNDSEDRFEGIIETINPILNPASNKIDIEITPNKNRKIKAGTLAKIFFNPKSENLNLIPLNSIIIKNNEKYVKIISQPKNEVILVKITTGDIIGNYISVKEGLNPGDIVIKSGTTFLEEGNKVKINTQNE